MPKVRSTALLLVMAGVAPALILHCSSADAPPGGFRPQEDASGTGGTGTIGVDVTTNRPVICNEPTDSDGDGIADEIENDGTADLDDARKDDLDGDGTPDRDDDDTDGDGISDQVERGHNDPNTCAAPVDTDDDGQFDFEDADSDGDGVLDALEKTGCVKDCRIEVDCDEDPGGAIDIIEVAAGDDPCDDITPPDAELFFEVPFNDGEKRKRFTFSTGVRDADIYFMIDTTTSMQPAIDNIRASLDTTIIPSVLNGNPTANPPIPPVPGAWIGISDFKDVPWSPWGAPGDGILGFRFDLAGTGTLTYGNVSPPIDNAGTLSAPQNVRDILNSLTANGGGDAPEAATQALWLASTNEDYRAVGGGEPWPPGDPPGSGNFDAAEWRQNCDDPSYIGRACFRPGKLPVMVIITDAGFHNGPTSAFDYRPPPGGNVNGTKTYAAVLDKLNSISAKVVGVPVNTGTPGQARNDLIKLAEDTNSFFFEPAFGAGETPLVADETGSGNVSTEVARLIGLLAGLGVNNVTTLTENFSCAGNIDCNGDSIPDPPYENFVDQSTMMPFDASTLVKDVVTVDSPPPRPYAGLDVHTFFGVRGDTTVEFEVVAENTTLRTTSIVVVRALLRVETPTGQALGGADGVKTIFLVIPPAEVVF